MEGLVTVILSPNSLVPAALRSHAIQLTKELRDEVYDELAIIALCDRVGIPSYC